MKPLTPALAFFLAVLAAAPAAAHPHVWIDAAIVPVFDQSGRFVAVHERWAMDALYTESILTDLETSRDGILQPQELAFAQSARTALWWMLPTYFTRLTLGGKAVDHAAPDDIRVSLPFDRLIIEFTLPLAAPVAVGASAGIDLYDPDNYFAFEFSEPWLYPSLVPENCTAARKAQPDLDPTAVMILKRLGLTTSPAILEDPAAGFPFRVTIDCQAVGAEKTR